MNGTPFGTEGFGDSSVDPYYTYDLKLQQQLAKQHFGSPMAGSDPFNQVTSSDLGVYNDPQSLAELEKLSNEYSPKYTVFYSICCLSGAKSSKRK